MKCVRIEGLNKDVYRLIAPFAMNPLWVKSNGNPITTSNKHHWFVCTDNDDDVKCFCAIRKTLSNDMYIMTLFSIVDDHRDACIKEAIKYFKESKGHTLKAYSNKDNLPIFFNNGFAMHREGKDWHTLILVQ